MNDVNEMFSDLMIDAEVNKREFLLEKIQNGEKISNAKAPWTAERLEKASDKVVEKLCKNYQNSQPVIGSAESKVNTQEALEMGKPVCPRRDRNICRRFHHHGPADERARCQGKTSHDQISSQIYRLYREL